MDAVFLKILNMSITASYLVLAVILLRLVLSKAPKWTRVVLWSFVALRLLVPVSLKSVLSLIPSVETIPEYFTATRTPMIDSGIPAVNHAINPILQSSLTPTVGASVNPAQVWVFVFANIWVCGMAFMAVYTLVSYLRIRRRVREAVLLRENIWLCDRIGTPFLLGLIRPRIYLPVEMAEADAEYVIAHERAHLKRRDHVWKPLGFLLLTVHWFNPVLWVAYILLCRDIELACDERVLRKMGTESKKPYSQALINCSMPRRQIAACPLAFGEVGVKTRIRGILYYKKPAFWILLVAVAVLTAAAVCLLTDPVGGTLRKIEKRDLTQTAQDTVVLRIEDHGESMNVIGFPQENLQALLDLRISQGEVSKNRSEDRDMSHTVELLFRFVLEEGDVGTAIHFSDDFTEVWVDDNVKPTLSYRVLEPDWAEKLYNGLCGYPVPELETELPMSAYSNIYRFEREGDASILMLSRTDNTCMLVYSLHHSYCPRGTYEETAEQVTVTLYDGARYVFRRDRMSLLFQAGESSGFSMASYGPDYMKTATAEDGAVFRAVFLSNGLMIDSIRYDIDRDGTEEICTLAYGVTSGLFSFSFLVTQDEIPEYTGMFVMDHAELRFTEQDGELKVQAVTTMPAEVRCLDISLQDGAVILTENGNPIHYWH